MDSESLSAFVSALPVSATLVLGGSRALNEQNNKSDTDLYLVTHTTRELFILLWNRQQIEALKKQYHIFDSLILLSRSLMRNRWYYVYGYTLDGTLVHAPFDARLQRNNALKVAYASFIEGNLKKALRYGIYSAALASSGRLIHSGPLFSKEAILAQLKQGQEQVKRIFRGENDEQAHTFVLQVLDEAYRLFRKSPLSTRSQFLYVVFGLRKGSLRPLTRNMDRWIIEELRALVFKPDKAAYQKIRKHLLMILYI